MVLHLEELWVLFHHLFDVVEATGHHLHMELTIEILRLDTAKHIPLALHLLALVFNFLRVDNVALDHASDCGDLGFYLLFTGAGLLL